MILIFVLLSTRVSTDEVGQLSKAVFKMLFHHRNDFSLQMDLYIFLAWIFQIKTYVDFLSANLSLEFFVFFANKEISLLSLSKHKSDVNISLRDRTVHLCYRNFGITISPNTRLSYFHWNIYYVAMCWSHHLLLRINLDNSSRIFIREAGRTIKPLTTSTDTRAVYYIDAFLGMLGIDSRVGAVNFFSFAKSTEMLPDYVNIDPF